MLREMAKNLTQYHLPCRSRLFDLAAFIVSNSGGSSSSDMSTISLSAIRAIIGLTAVHLLLTQLTDVLILLLLSHLCIGILVANLSELTPTERVLRRSIPIVGIVLALLTAANVGATISYYTISPSSPVFGVNMAYQVCICTASLLVGSWAITVKLRTRGVAELNQVGWHFHIQKPQWFSNLGVSVDWLIHPRPQFSSLFAVFCSLCVPPTAY
jgi:hypothetical protein